WQARRWVLAVALVTALALVLRVVGIGAHSFWYDEAVTAELTEKSYAELVSGQAKDLGNPPLYWVLARAWTGVFGRDELGFRSLSVSVGVLAVPALALLGRRLFGPGTGLLAAGLLAVAPLAIELADEARTYALVQLLAVVNALFFVRWLDRRGAWDFVLYALTL